MSNIIEGFVQALIMFGVSGLFLTQSGATKADTNCTATCDGMIDLVILFFFLGGAWGIGVAMGLLRPISSFRYRAGRSA
jgi:hypothetical protein